MLQSRRCMSTAFGHLVIHHFVVWLCTVDLSSSDVSDREKLLSTFEEPEDRREESHFLWIRSIVSDWLSVIEHAVSSYWVSHCRNLSLRLISSRHRNHAITCNIPIITLLASARQVFLGKYQDYPRWLAYTTLDMRAHRIDGGRRPVKNGTGWSDSTVPFS